MDFNDYQEQAMRTCLPSCANVPYMLGLIQEEAGELQGKFNKELRREKLEYDENRLVWHGTPEEYDELVNSAIKEMGDVLWGISGLCKVLGVDLSRVGQVNIEKLAARKKAGTISGEGDGISGAERKSL